MTAKNNNGLGMDKNEQKGISTDTIVYRLGAMEAQVKEVRSDLRTLQSEIMLKLDVMARGFATHKDVDNAKVQAEMEHKAIYKKIEDVESEVNNMKKRSWVSNTLSAAFGILLTLLITYAFTSIIK